MYPMENKMNPKWSSFIEATSKVQHAEYMKNSTNRIHTHKHLYIIHNPICDR